MFKALGESWTTSPMNWKDIEIIFGNVPEKKIFSVHLSGFAKQIYESLGEPEIYTDYQLHDEFVIFEVILLHA
jgi:hypothetical protein